MITYSIIQKSKLEGGLRLDGEYYQPEYLESQKALANRRTMRLDEAAKVSDGNHGSISASFSPTDGVRYLRGKDLNDFFVSDDDPVYIPESEYLKIKRSHIFKEDVLVSIVGTVGLVSIVADDSDKLTGNCKIAILRSKKIDPWFLSVFLISRYGQNQIQRKVAGAVQTGIILKDLSAIQIPSFDENEQKRIREVVEAAYYEQVRSESLYSQAEDLLLEELGLKNFEVDDDLSYIVNLSDIKSAHRADAEYFQPKYEKLVEKLKKHNAQLLKELVRRVKAKTRPKSEEVYKYIEISDISVGSGDVSFNEIIGKELPANARIPIKGGELLVSKVRPTRGAIAIVPNNFDNNFICSGAFSVFSAPEVMKEYLFVVSHSIVGKLQFKKPTTGTSYPTITDEDVENLIIPVLPKPTQQKIADLVQKSHEARSKAKQLLEQAKQKVEEMIESEYA